MASSRCPISAGLALVALGITAAGCSRATLPVAAAPRAVTAAVDPGVELPPGPGREILLRDCLACHDLGGLGLFSGFYGRDDWHTLVLTMISHGAAVDADEVEVLADYLALHFGP